MIQITSQQRKLQLEVTATSPIVLCAADENYVKPLAVTLHSAASNLAPGHHLQVVLLDGGISESSWGGLRETMNGLPVSVQVIRPDLSQVSDLMTSHHISHAAYLRLLASEILPEHIEKVVYLDSDLLVLDDVTKLWQMDLGDAYAAASIDIACPFVDAREHFAAADFTVADFGSVPYVAAVCPISNWRELGIDGAGNYFNSGVMVLNLKRWREDDISQKLFDCLRENREHVWCWDQYALNVVFSGNWKPLDPKWNQGTHVYEYPSAQVCPIAPDQFLEMCQRPSIVHFTTEYKPWQYRHVFPNRELFYDQLDQTAFVGWRPEDPGFRFGQWWTFHVVQLIRSGVVNYRRWFSFRKQAVR
jgi:lipopolysaccharide biosynthesis glycosyltransferase